MARRVAVISDIHANWQALEAVLEAVEQEQPDELWCLGDLVGYGPRPNPCCAAMEQRVALCLAGNHDLGVLGQLDLSEFSGDAVEAARWTRGVLAEGSRTYLESLRPLARRDGVELFHASPRDPVWDYVLSAEAAAAAFELTEEPLLLVGHSHVPLALALQDGELAGGLAPEGTEADLSGGRFLLNPGSVGQPRDGDPRAAWLLLDFDARRASFRRAPYPVERTQAEIRGRGLPDALAQRIARGL
ncbi:MAG: metallophosphatase family protein [Actinomycetota bacterium]|nr:metallophosphatase family protein [Actinomycetota bacterium]